MPPVTSPSDLPAETAPAATTSTVERDEANRLWPRSTTALLLLVGIVMGLIGFATVMSMGDMAWHGARDAELRSTYEAYQETGTLLIKETGSGSYGVQAPADGPLTFATWDDDPGSYIIASLMYNITGSDSPYPGLKLAQALLVALPLIWLPLAVARIVGRARAGFALVLLPLVVWLFNHGATLVGTEYGLSDRVNTLPVYSLYGTAASLAFLSLSLIVLLSSYRLRLLALIGATVGIAVLAAFGNLSRSLSGMGIAAAVGVLWWLFARGRWRWISAVGGALVTIVLATVLQTGMMTAINIERASTTGQAMTEVPDAHTAWHSLYLGLSYPTPLNGEPSHFAVTWADEYGWAKAREVDPDVLVASEEYDEILQGLYLDEVLGDPVGAVKLYVKKALYLGAHFGGLLLFIVIGFAVGLSIKTRMRPRLGRTLAIATPLLLLGLVPAVLVMPMLYYYSELAAALGLLAAVALGVIIWAISSWPARVRAREADRLAGDSARRHGGVPGLSVVLDGERADAATVAAFRDALSDEDELVIGTTDSDSAIDDAEAPVAGGVESEGQRLRRAVLSSTRDRVLVLGGVVPGDPAALVASAKSADLGASDDGQDRAGRRGPVSDLTERSAIRSARRVLLLDGSEARALASVSRERSTLWFEEMSVASSDRDANASLRDGDAPAAVEPDEGGWRSRLSTLLGRVKVALRREEYLAALRR